MANRTCSRGGEPCYSARKGSQLNPPLTSPLSHVARLALLCSPILMSPVLPAAAQSTSWNATNFEVLPIDPWASVGNPPPDSKSSFLPINQLRAQITVSPMTGTLAAALFQRAAEAEGALKDAGNIYASIGLKEPFFGPFFPRNQPNTRLAFMYNFFQGQQETHKQALSICLPLVIRTKVFQENWIAIDLSLQGKNNRFVYPIHELFHAIQAQYPFQKGRCKIVGWIDEGTADAAAYFLLERRLAEKDFPSSLGFYGLRPYDIPLYLDIAWYRKSVKKRFGIVENSDADTAFSEHTNSFWRYLMDRYDVSPNDKYNPKRLLARAERFMKHAPQGNWLDWVASRVLDKPFIWGPSFPLVYGQFLAEFAAWPGSKYKDFPVKKWLNLGFGGCEKRTLSPNNKSAKITLKPEPDQGEKFSLYPLAERCIQDTVKGFKGKRVMLDLEAEVKQITGKDINNNDTVVKTAEEVADQLVLGFAREERKGTLVENCYSLTRKKPNDQLPCAYKGGR